MNGEDSAAAVVLAGGSGHRFGAAGNKVYLPLAGAPVLAWSLRAFAAAGVTRIVLVVRAGDEALAEQAARHAPIQVEMAPGGASRHGSEHNALLRLEPDIRSGAVDVVAVHDGARPLVRSGLVRSCLDAARRYGAAVPGVPVDDLLTVAPDGPAPAAVSPVAAPATPGPGRLVRVQTPQAFRAGPLLDAYQRAALDGFTGTDTAACVERYAGLRVHHVAGDPRNLKVTYQRDLAVAAVLLETLDGGTGDPEPGSAA